MQRTMASALALSLFALRAAAAPAPAAAPRPALDGVLAGAAALDTFRGVAIAPDGRRLAWIESRTGAGPLAAHASAIEVAELAAPGPPGGPGASTATSALAGAPWQLTAGSPRQAAAIENSPAWSPDGRRLAFVSDAASPGQLDLYVAPAAAPDGRRAGGAPPRRLTHFSGQMAAPRWSPDGRSIALLVIAGRRELAGPLAAAPRDAGVVGEQPQEQRLAVVDVESGALRLVSPTDLYVYEYAWTPDGRGFAATAAHGSGDDNWYVAELWSIAADGTAARSLWKPAVQIAAPCVSPDGRSIAVIGGLMSDFGSNGGDVWVVSTGAAGEEAAARDVTAGRATSTAWLAWTAPPPSRRSSWEGRPAAGARRRG